MNTNYQGYSSRNHKTTSFCAASLARLNRPIRRAFTVVELTVALVVMSICLLGVGSLLQETISAERVAVQKNQRRAAARAIASEFAAAIESAAFGPDASTSISCGPNRDRLQVLTCYVQSDPVSRAPMERRRYFWKVPRPGEGTSISVQFQRHMFAGSHSIDPAPDTGDNGDEVWTSIPAVEIGKGISGMMVQFRKRGEPSGAWAESWSGSPAEAEAKISVTVEDQVVERIVIPRVDAPLAEKS